MGQGRYPVIEFDSKIITSKIVIKGLVTLICVLTLFVWYVFKTEERDTERRAVVPKGGGGGYSLHMLAIRRGSARSDVTDHLAILVIYSF